MKNRLLAETKLPRFGTPTHLPPPPPGEVGGSPPQQLAAAVRPKSFVCGRSMEGGGVGRSVPSSLSQFFPKFSATAHAYLLT